MTKYINLFIILSIISIIFINNTNTKSISKSKKESNDDNYYLIFVKTDSKYIFPKPGESRQKRHDNNGFIDAMIEEIHSLIIENKDTYKNVTKLEEINEGTVSLDKRNESGNVEHPYDYDDSNLAYPISSVKGETVINAYLSKELIPTIKSLPNVSDCIKNREIKMSYYNVDEIKKETKWKDLKITEKAALHLSLISQGKYDDTLIDQYDRNYYYPRSAGKGVDIVILDSGFNLNHTEFTNSKERTVKCECAIRNGKIEEPTSDNYCHRIINPTDNHGIKVADTAVGAKYGVAPKANLYAILLDNTNTVNILRGLEYTKDNLVNNHKTVVNLSFGYYFKPSDSFIKHMKIQIDEINNNNGIVVASAGNFHSPVYHHNNTDINFYPCYFDSTICVGGIDNVYDDNYDLKYMKTEYYTRADFSNFGDGVDIWAPGYSKVSYANPNNELIKKAASGTSFSSPIVAGVIATVMNEHPDVTYNKDSMLTYLKKIGIKNAIKDMPDAIFINNGKHVVYSSNYSYHGCGINAGNIQCGFDQCCTSDGHCQISTDLACQTTQGCQVDYGQCTVVRSKEEDRCGEGFGSCEEGLCCSYEGYCGKASGYCDAGCQKNYGFCN